MNKGLDTVWIFSDTIKPLWSIKEVLKHAINKFGCSYVMLYNIH